MTSNESKQRYQQAHKKWFATEYPNAYRNGHYSPPKMPQVAKANGLTKFIENYVNWSGYRATRISTTGRKIGDKWIKGTTRRGTSDLSCTIKGKTLMLEIKTGRDKPSIYQLKEQERERKAGGIYEFCSTVEEFFEIFDKILSLCKL